MATGLAVTVKNAPGRHDQTTHGNWASGSGEINVADRIRAGNRDAIIATIKGDGKRAEKQQIADALALLPENHKTNLVELNAHNVSDLRKRGIAAGSSLDVRGSALQKTGLVDIACKRDDDLDFATVHEVGHLQFTDHPAVKNTDPAFIARRDKAWDGLSKLWQDRGYEVQHPEAEAVSKYAKSSRDEFLAENYAHYIIHPYYMQRKDPETYGIMRDFFQGQEYGMAQRTVKEGWHILPWWAARIYQIVAHKELPIPAQQRRLSARTSAYERELKQLWEDAKAKLRSGELTPDEFARQMADVADGAFLPAVAEVLGIDESELTAEQRAMITAHLTDNRGWIQDSLMPDIVKALADPEADLGLFDYRIAALYGGALWNLGSLATVTFDGVSMRDLADLFLFAGPKDDRTCTGPRGCDQHVGQAYPVAYILAQNIVPGNFVCQHSCRHMLIPLASLPEKQRPKPSPVHSDIELVYGAEKHLPGMHNQMSHGSWARRTPEGGKRTPLFAIGEAVGTLGRRVISLDYKSYGGAKAWLKKQPNAADLQIVRTSTEYYVVTRASALDKPSKAEAVSKDAISPDFPDGMGNDEKTAQLAAISTHFNAGEPAQDTRYIRVDEDASVSAKLQVQHKLEDATGESPEDCRQAIRSWAGTSNDTRLPSLAMQEAAEEEFGSKRTDWQKEQLLDPIQARQEMVPEHRMPWDDYSYPFEEIPSNKQGWPGDTKPRTKAFLRAQYDATQKALKDAGVTHVVVYRGTGKLRDQDGKPIDATPGTRIHYRGNAMESWSLLRTNPGAGKFGMRIISAVIPASRILSTPRTGFGCLGEYEVVVLGGLGAGDMVEVRN